MANTKWGKYSRKQRGTGVVQGNVLLYIVVRKGLTGKLAMTKILMVANMGPKTIQAKGTATLKAKRKDSVSTWDISEDKQRGMWAKKDK